jgi:hypothetical protein
MSELSELLSQEGKKKYAEIEKWFDEIANQLMNYHCLKVGGSEYRITECEFYYREMGGEHNDIYVHTEKPQLTIGQLYLNKAGGFDLTFGKDFNDETKNIYGGILIRGIRNLKTNERFNNITKIVTDFFDKIGNIINETRCISIKKVNHEYLQTCENPNLKLIKVNRHNLKYNIIDADSNYFNKPYRYIVELVSEHKFLGKENVVKRLVQENQIKPKDVFGILGNNLKI